MEIEIDRNKRLEKEKILDKRTNHFFLEWMGICSWGGQMSVDSRRACRGQDDDVSWR